MRIKKSKRLYKITLEFHNGVTRDVPVRAVTREIAEKRALKRNPSALRVKVNH